jgi:hypothetical protein
MTNKELMECITAEEAGRKIEWSTCGREWNPKVSKGWEE